MKINLNNPEEFTIENFAKLMAETDDSVHTQYRVTNDGYFFASTDVGNRNLQGILFRFETNSSHNGYAGPTAAENSNWVQRIFDSVKENYPNPYSTYIDNF
ncbi:hypothetical protein A1704_00215 [Chryseobacterium cucumeris]|uniref:hypothetical protein n=1 Tax=Chryseobacterium cucumeris TaxID=1813611 RepID=UPI0007878C8D|nr:hypothetical protein [Chryseobacterium cucumeris]KYH07139.1 hypothetical protein A1704_00215 [Chryseobacterium cucumeris]